ncbi:response regulator [Paraburkholderia diazotrophica]|uniref:response regulator n=1 Tax=Paraburkholderia diazotrophica TaxID=667676 RepID=UPI0031783F79
MHRILLVEDDEPTRSALRWLLEAEGYHVICATNGAQAVAQLAVTAVDLVISDWSMPELDGVQLSQTLRSRPAFRLLPFILMSSNAAPEQHRSWDAYLRKPFVLSHLTRTVRSLLRARDSVVTAEDDRAVQAAVRFEPAPMSGTVDAPLIRGSR